MNDKMKDLYKELIDGLEQSIKMSLKEDELETQMRDTRMRQRVNAESLKNVLTELINL